MNLKKVIVASDSFKGTLSSKEIIDIYKEVFLRLSPNTEVIGLTIADGGEGTVESISNAIKGNLINVHSKNPLLKDHVGTYFISEDNEAFIEVASSDGLTLINDKNPGTLSSYGVGLEIKDAVSRGVDKIYLGLGGSATNDGGAGLLSTLGIHFLNKENREFIPTGLTLKDISKIDLTSFSFKTKIELMSDVKNPLLGKNGATYVYSKQKGADESMQKELENNMLYFANLVSTIKRRDYSIVPGAGAAGGIGFGCLAFLNARINSGIDIILEKCNFKKIINGADFIFTGEGRLDSQTNNGKAVAGISKIANELNVPVIAVVGSIKDNIEEIKNNLHLNEIVITSPSNLSFEEIKKNAYSYYKDKLTEIVDTLIKK